MALLLLLPPLCICVPSPAVLPACLARPMPPASPAAAGLQVQHAERSVREIATLNQMFSTAIMQQGEQIEKLYSEAVQATRHIDRANVQLGKAIRTNRAARKYMIAFFLIASLGLIFLDWFNS